MAQRVPAPQERSPQSKLPQPTDPTIGKLVTDLSRDVSTLISKEIELAKSEIKFSVRMGGMGAVFFAAAAFLLLLAVIIGSVAIAFFLHFTGLDLAWCLLIVTVFYLLVAGLLGFIGYRKVRKVGPPKESIEQLQETKAVLTRKRKP